MERRNDERDSLRVACRREIDELHEADDDEHSDVIVDAVAKAAAKTAARITLPDSDSDAPPKRKAPGAPAVAAAIVALGAVAAAVLEALRQAGVVK